MNENYYIFYFENQVHILTQKQKLVSLLAVASCQNAPFIWIQVKGSVEAGIYTHM